MPVMEGLQPHQVDDDLVEIASNRLIVFAPIQTPD